MIDFRTQDEILYSWTNYDQLIPIVSVIVPTYNHKKYISEAIDSILMQRTDFAFEIIIHDDASTDGTQLILGDYCKKYPKIIKTILRRENIYSKGFKISPLVMPFTRGKYIAFCEGDDCWTDKNKLAKQVRVLEKYPDVYVCGHRLDNIDHNGVSITNKVFTSIGVKKIFNLSDAISGSPLHPSTWMYRRVDWSLEPHLDLLNKLPAADDPTMLIFLTKGDGYCIPEECSSFRVHSGGSWSTLNNYDQTFKMLQFHLASFSIIRPVYFPYLIMLSALRVSEFFSQLMKYALYAGLKSCLNELKRLIKNQRSLNLAHIPLIFLVVILSPVALVIQKIRILYRSENPVC